MSQAATSSWLSETDNRYPRTVVTWQALGTPLLITTFAFSYNYDQVNVIIFKHYNWLIILLQKKSDLFPVSKAFFQAS